MDQPRIPSLNDVRDVVKDQNDRIRALERQISQMRLRREWGDGTPMATSSSSGSSVTSSRSATRSSRSSGSSNSSMASRQDSNESNEYLSD